MGLYDGFRISMSGMDAQTRRLRLVASNLANANSTRSATGEVYRRKDIIFSAVPIEQGKGGGNAFRGGLQKVKTAGIVEDPSPLKKMFMPDHPDADKKGYVHFPNVKMFEEVVHMMDAIKSYEANVMAFNSSKDMMKKALEIGR